MKSLSLIASFFVVALFLAACEDPEMDPDAGVDPTEQQQDY